MPEIPSEEKKDPKILKPARTKMTPEEVQRYQAMLRKAHKENPAVPSHVHTLEDFSTENINREAYRKARGLGHLKYIYHGKIYSTRLSTESHTEHLETMLASAKEASGPEMIGGEAEAMPMALESKSFSRDEITRLIIEEWTNAYLEDKIMKINEDTLKNLVVKELSNISESRTTRGPADIIQKRKRRRRL